MSKVTSDGSTASYYELPEGAQELQHLISYRNMNGQLAEIFRACYRYGIVSHSDQLRDAKKMVFYAMAEVERLEKWSKVGGLQRHEATPNVLEFDEARADAIGQNGNDGEHYGQDLTNPRNWRAGDWVECVDDSAFNGLHEGRIYLITEVCERLGVICLDIEGLGIAPLANRFRFHARPDADGWIEHAGGAMPVKPDVMVDFETARTGAIYCIARNVPWPHVVRYRPHLATKQDNG